MNPATAAARREWAWLRARWVWAEWDGERFDEEVYDTLENNQPKGNAT
jgi:hypothetical protein